jgi:hypothetical protein
MPSGSRRHRSGRSADLDTTDDEMARPWSPSGGVMHPTISGTGGPLGQSRSTTGTGFTYAICQRRRSRYYLARKMERAGLAPGTVLESSKGPVMNESQYSPDESGSHVSTPALGLPDPAVIHAAALRYAEMGWRVFPITKERVPLIKGFPTIPAPSVEQVNRWWGDGRKYEHPQIGLATGDQGDGRVVFVIDVDC